MPRTSNTSGYAGVTWHRLANKWMASRRVDGRYQYLGLFDQASEAHQAYLQAGSHLAGAAAEFENRKLLLLDRVNNLLAQHGLEALSVPFLEKHGLYNRLRAVDLAQGPLLIELGLAQEYEEWRRAHRPYRGHVRPTWTWELAIDEAKKIKEEHGELQTLEWCRRNGYSHLGNVVFKSGHSWEDLREAVGCFKTAPYRQSRNGIRWRSQPECCFSNFLYARGIEHKRGERYSFQNPDHAGHHCYDIHFRALSGHQIDVEIWGDMPALMDGGIYGRTRVKKEEWRKNDNNFLGIQYRDCLSDQRLTKLLQPYIGEIEPFVFDKVTDKLIQTAFWSDADDLLENCRKFAAEMRDGIFPGEDWLRKRGRYADRPGEAYNTLAVRVNQWLGGTRNVRKILGHEHASTTAWTPKSVILAWQKFADDHGVTPSQIKGREARLRFSQTAITEGCRIYEVARRLGVLDQARNGKTAKVKWTDETTALAWREFVARHGRTPSQCMSAGQRQALPKEITNLATNIYSAARKLGLLSKLRQSN